MPRVFIAGIVLALASAGLASAQTPMSVRSVLVSVSDGNGRPVVGLVLNDFEIEIDGLATDALDVKPARFPLVLMVDTGAAASRYVTLLRAPLLKFAERTILSPLSLITFGDTPVVAVKFTPDARRVARGIDGLFARPDTASYLLDGLQRAASEVKRLERPVTDVVVVAAASFDASRRDADRLVRELSEAHIRVHVVLQRPHVLATMPTPAPRSPRSVSPADTMLYTSREQAALLTYVSAVTGGTFQQIDLVSGLAGALQRIHEGHLGEYVVDFESPSAAPSAEGLRLKVNLPGAHARLTSLGTFASRAKDE